MPSEKLFKKVVVGLGMLIGLFAIFFVFSADIQKSFGSFLRYPFSWEKRGNQKIIEALRPQIVENLKLNQFPSKLAIDPATLKTSGPDFDSEISVDYTIDPDLQRRALQILNSYRPDYAALVAMDARSGAVVSIISYSRSSHARDLGHLALRADFPAASIFKVITAAAAIDKAQFDANSEIVFHGGNHTLYRRNVEGRTGGWERKVSFRSAFARSINTVFGKVGLLHLGKPTLEEYAKRFLFNQEIPSDLPVSISRLQIPDENWGVVEAASGFTKNTTLSAFHGALIAAAIANDGEIPSPHILNQVQDHGNILYSAAPQESNLVIEPRVAKELQIMMADTVTNGTSRKAFRRLLKGRKTQAYLYGGKTGSLTGEDPKGKYDWFVGYGKNGAQSLAISVLTIHEELWRVKSAQVAAEFLDTAMVKGWRER